MFETACGTTQMNLTLHPQSHLIQWANSSGEGMWGWIYAPPGRVSHAIASGPMGSGLSLEAYLCWYYVEGGWVRMLCFHYALGVMRMW